MIFCFVYFVFGDWENFYLTPTVKSPFLNNFGIGECILTRLALTEAYAVECYSCGKIFGLVLFLKDALNLFINKFNLKGDGSEH